MHFCFMELIMIVLSIAVGVFLTLFLTKKKSGPMQITSSSTVLDNIKKVSKLVTVEGTFTEIVTYSEDRPKWQGLFKGHKKALVVVKAKALLGANLTQTEYQVDEKSKQITVTKPPSVEIISIEPDIQFYDIKDSVLNRFKPQDLSALQKKAIEDIRKKVEESELPQLADERIKETYLMFAQISKAYGWNLQVHIADKSLNQSNEEPPK